MKPIKNIRKALLVFVLISTSVFAQIQDRKNAPFTGIWEYQKGNRIFRLILWENPSPNAEDKRYYLDGHYQMIEVNGVIETILNATNPDFITTKRMPVTLRGTVDDGVYHGIFEENYVNASSIEGKFNIKLVPSCSDCQPKISWEMTQLYRIDPVTNNPTSSVPFLIPNGAVLVKTKD